MKLTIALIALLSLVPAYSATTGTIVLSGTVPTDCGIVVNTAASASTLNIVGGVSALNIASVTETCNNPTGFRITMSSANTSNLKNGTLLVPYTIQYASGSYVAAGTTAAPVTVKTVASLVTKLTATSNVLMNMTAVPNSMAGTFTDTITLTIVAP